MLWEIGFDPKRPNDGFSALIDAWRAPQNKVFVLRAEGEVEDVKAFFDVNLRHIGTPCAFAEDVAIGDRKNQRSGEIWMEVRYDPRHPDAYRHSPNAQPLHTDGSYIPEFPNATLMCCVANAGSGGETTFIDGEDVIACLRDNNPNLLERLTSGHIRHSRSGDERNEYVIDLDSCPPLMNWNYYCLAPDLSERDRQASVDFFNFLQNDRDIALRTLAVKLYPGDAVVWKDRQILHGRNAFQATKASERYLWKCAVDVGRFVAQS